jgi:hypothetical protein
MLMDYNQPPQAFSIVNSHIVLSDCLDETRSVAPERAPRLFEGEDTHYFHYPFGVVNGPLPADGRSWLRSRAGRTFQP